MLEYLEMENKRDSKSATKAGNHTRDDACWFRDTPHYWAEASLPLAYAVACVEVVSRRPEEGRILCNLSERELRYHWTDIGMFAISCVYLGTGNIGMLYFLGRSFKRRQSMCIELR